MNVKLIQSLCRKSAWLKAAVTVWMVDNVPYILQIITFTVL